MSATKELLQLDPDKYLVEFSPNEFQIGHHSLKYLQPPHGPTGISVAEGELLYSLIRMTRPAHVLEGGTNIGVSTSYICLALRDNNFGTITTCEHSQVVADIADKQLKKQGFNNYKIFAGDFKKVKIDKIDFLNLDTELATRYDEFVHFYDKLADDANICIHDHPRLDCDILGKMPDDLKSKFFTGELRCLTFDTAHGISVWQKSSFGFYGVY